MNSCYGFARKTLFTLLVFVLALTGVAVGSAQAEGAPASSDDAYVYYVSNGDLYRVRTDGSPAQKIRDNFDGVELKPAGDYLYYLSNGTSTTLLRMSLTDDKAKVADFGGDKRILHYITEGDFIYYMDDKGGIYRASSNDKKATDGILIADMADTNFPEFTVTGGRVYYNALRNGRTTWVASKTANSGGSVQWIASGAFTDDYFAHTYNNMLYLMVDTKPAETTYSLNCMVLYTLPAGGGTPKAINAKAPLDANSVMSGSWANDYYLFNKGISLGSDEEYDYTTGKGVLMDRNGKLIALNQTGVYEIANLGANKFAYVDAKGKAYVSTIANGKVTSTKALPLTNVGYVRNLMNAGKVRSTVLFAESGGYVLNPNLTLTKMVGVEWDLCVYKEDVAGLFYVNAGDNGRLYRMSEDGKTTVKLSDEKVSRIVLISKN